MDDSSPLPPESLIAGTGPADNAANRNPADEDSFALGGADDDLAFVPNFVPVPVRERHDGWTPPRQVAFIEALAQCGCVDQAARSVGMTARSAYRLRQHGFAQPLRRAWDAALAFAMQRLADAALSRAIHGVVRPVFFQGEQVGERRYYDERLTQFLLTRRDPARFGKAIDQFAFDEVGGDRALHLAVSTLRLAIDNGDGEQRGAQERGDVSRPLRPSGGDKGGADGAADNDRAAAAPIVSAQTPRAAPDP